MLIRDEAAESKWTAILVVDSDGDHIAYVLTSRLKKNKKKTVYTRDISKINMYCVAQNSTKSYSIYSQPTSGSEKIAVLRRAIVLPVIVSGDKFTSVLTQNGIGYIRNDHIAIIDN